MSDKIAIIGNGESVYAFKAAGVDAFVADGAAEARDTLRRLAQKLAPGLYGMDDTYYTQPQTLPALPDVDTARGWRNAGGDRCELILTAGRRVIRITWTDPDGTLGFDRLAPQLAEGFLQGAQPDV